LLAEIARNAKDPDVRWTAVDRVTDPTAITMITAVVADIAKNHLHSGVRKAAVVRVTDQSVLADIAKNDKHPDVRKAAVSQLTDQSALANIAKNDKHPDVRKAAMGRVTDHGLIADITVSAQYRSDVAVSPINEPVADRRGAAMEPEVGAIEGKKVFRGSQTAFLGSKEWTFSFTKDSLLLTTPKDNEPTVIPRSQSELLIRFCSSAMWGYDVIVRRPKGDIKLQLSSDALSFLKSWVHLQRIADLETVARSSRAQARISLLSWFFTPAFFTSRTGPGVGLAKQGQACGMFAVFPTLIAIAKEQDPTKMSGLYFLLMLFIGAAIFLIWKGYQKHCEANEKGERT